MNLPDFNRKVWKNDIIKDVWEYRINKIKQMYSDLELLTVKEKVRDAGFKFINVDKFNHQRNELYKDLFIAPVKFSSQNKSGYSINSGQTGNLKNEPATMRYLAMRKDNIINVNKFLENKDNYMGKKLGYPECCINFFDKIWNNKNKIDTTWYMAKNTKNVEVKNISTGKEITLKDISPYNNILLRWLGVRFVPYLPHSFDCKETKEIAKKWEKVALKYGYEREIEWIKELLSMNIEWTALHGIVIIKTPIFKIMDKTDYTSDELKVIVKGNEEVDTPNKWLWEDNGFSSYSAMEESHKPIEDTLNEIEFNSIMDLGCGNGYLLSKLDADRFGIDLNNNALEHSEKVTDISVENKNIKDYEWANDVDIVSIALCRMIEMSNEERKQFKKKMINFNGKIVAHAYGDWLETYGSLDNIAHKLGLILSNKKAYYNSQAGLITGIKP